MRGRNPASSADLPPGPQPGDAPESIGRRGHRLEDEREVAPLVVLRDVGGAGVQGDGDRVRALAQVGSEVEAEPDLLATRDAFERTAQVVRVGAVDLLAEAI